MIRMTLNARCGKIPGSPTAMIGSRGHRSLASGPVKPANVKELPQQATITEQEAGIRQ